MTSSTEKMPVGGTELYFLRGGSGRPCLFLHGIEGHEGWLPVYEALASANTVIAPSHPGYGHTPAPEWITSVPHQAVFYNWFLQEAGFTDVDLVGAGLGGWIAAEMAIMDSSRLRHLALLDATGVRPREGEIFDVFVAPWRQVIERGFHNPDQYQRIYGENPIQEFGGVREAGRTMSTRMCFKPYMHDPALPGMLPKIRVPTLVIWGDADEIVPVQCGRQYADAIPGAKLHVVPECGHFAHLDQPQRVASLLGEFFSS